MHFSFLTWLTKSVPLKILSLSRGQDLIPKKENEFSFGSGEFNNQVVVGNLGLVKRTKEGGVSREVQGVMRWM